MTSTNFIKNLDGFKKLMKSAIKDLPNSGFTMIILGASFSGKTTFLTHYLLPLLMKKNNIISIHTESLNSKPITAYLDALSDKKKDRMIVYDKLNTDSIEMQYKINQDSKNAYQFINILDDIIDLRGPTLNKCILTYRNSKITTIILTQYVKLLKPSQRGSVHFIIIVGYKNMEDIDPLRKMFLHGFIRENFQIKKADDINCYIRTILKKYYILVDNRKDEIYLIQKPTEITT